MRNLLKSKRFRVILAVLASLFVVACCVVFVLLVKVKGNISYLYNYMVKTEGSIPAEYFISAEQGANNLTPAATKNTDPELYLDATGLMVNGEVVTSYQRTQPIIFTKEWLDGVPYTKGIVTFRGNYARNLQSYGSCHLTKQVISENTWKVKTGKVLKCDGVNYWSGNGWTGQPLVIQWDNDMKQIMNLYPAAAAKKNLTEVIYPGMDGQIHFLDMETGKATRDSINVGMTFKGTCSLHPLGYPMLVCGSGDSQPGMFGEQVSARVFIYSLIDGKKLYELGANDSFAPRIWHAFDSSAVFCPMADSLICPGENGVLYTISLNTEFDLETSTLTVNPGEAVEFRYDAKTAKTRVYSGEGGYGSEASAVVFENYLFLGDNGGMFYCLDLNTMKMVWMQDVLEDVNSSPIFEIDENGNKYIYVATTLKYHTDEHHIGEAVIYKLNAMSGEVVWKKPYQVHTVLGLAGGILSTGVLGKGAISDCLFYSVSKVPDVDTSYLVALNKRTGDEIWRIELNCDAWSSAVTLYDDDGSCYLVQCCSNGDILLINALSGTIISKKNFGSNIEATPAVFNNRLVVGLRSEYILGIGFE